MKRKITVLILSMVFALICCGAVSADTVAVNDVVNGSVNVTASTNASNTPHQLNGSDCLPTVAHGTINGEVYVSSIANWASKSTTNNFNVPNGTVVYAKYYVGIWMPGTATSTFNGNKITSEAVYPSGMGVTWISYNVTNYVVTGQTNIATSTSTGGDDRQYGSTLVVVLQNESDPLIEYWITEGLDWLNYQTPVDWSNTTLAGTVDLNAVQNASLYSIHLTGYNYEDFNGYKLPTPTQHLAGDYFDALRWDNIQNLLVAENQKVNVGRGSDTYTSVVFHALTITYKEDAPDMVAVNITPTIVDPNVSNTMTATIKNQGKIDATSPFNVSLLVDGTVVDTQTVTSLASGNSTTVNFQWTPVGTKNTYNLTVIVDPENAIAEYLENNNVLDVLVGTSTASKPVAEFTANTTSGNEPLTVNFTDQSSNEPTSWFRDFGDGTSSTDQNPTHPYALPGVYNVTLTVTNAGGSSSTKKTDYITVNAVTPVAAFTANETSVTTSSSIQFTDTSTHYPTSWFWEFGDGTTSTEQNPTHTYTAPGIYTVKLAAINSAGFDTEEKTNYITAYITPVANFTATTTSGSSPFTVTFTDKSTNSPTEWLWDFGDGTTSTSKNPTHTYTNIGSYTVTLTATNIAGSNTTTKTGYIITSASNGPVWTAKSAWNTPDIGNYAAPCLADLDGDGDYDLLIGASTGVCYGYENTGNATSPVWTAKSAWNTPDVGSYAVPCLADLDGDGDYDLLIGASTGVCYGYENTAIKGNPDLTPTSVNVPSTIKPNTPCNVSAVISNNGTADVGAFVATLSVDGVVVDTQSVLGPVVGGNSTVNFTWTPTALKNYNITVTVDSVNGIDESNEINNAMAVIFTLPAPVAEFSADVTSGDSGLTVNFTDESSNAPNSWLWNFGDGTTSTEQNPTHTYTKSGTYTVTLTSANTSGSNSTTKTGYITVYALTLVAGFTANNTTGTGPFTVQFTDQTTYQFTHRPTSWFWEFGDGTTSTEQNPTHTYTVGAKYTVKLLAMNEFGLDSETKTNYITVYMMPVADFTASTTSGSFPVTVTFTDKSRNLPTAWLWDFGDGTTSTSQNPTHTYTSVGTYTVTLTATNIVGSNTSTKTGYITITQPIGPKWSTPIRQTADIGSCSNPIWADLDGDGDYDLLIGEKAGVCYAYENTGTTSSPVWTAKSTWNTPSIGTYANPAFADLDGDGDYDLLIGAYDGVTYAYENTGNITSPVWTAKPEWNVEDIGDSSNPCLGDLDGDGDYDMLIGAVVSPGHVYAYENTGNATSPVWTAKPAWDTPYYFTVSAPCLGDIDGDGDNDALIGWQTGDAYYIRNDGILLSTNPDLTPTSVDVPSSIIAGIPCTVSAVISNNGKLDVGAFVATLSVDGVVVDTQSVTGPAVGSTSTVTFNWNPDTSGNHSLMVTADSIGGITESDETNNTITEDANVKAPPVAEFTVNNTNVTILDSVQFTDLSNNSPTSWQWDFGDGSTSIEQNPTHTYSAPGKYTVKLTVTNSIGSDEEVKTDYITVNTPDLIVTGISPNVGAGAYMFANELNVISVTVENNGTAAAPESTLNVNINGTDYTVNVPALAVGESTTVTVTDPVSRKDGDNVPVNTTTNPNNTIPETNTSNNSFSTNLTVYNNGYKGKRYTDGSDIDTQSTFHGNYGVEYSSGNSAYSGSKWTSNNVTWTSSQLPIPSGATVTQVRLYQPYTWDATSGQPQLNVIFNGGNVVNYIGWYTDSKGFGSYNYPSGLFVYDVTSLFNTAGNTLNMTPGTGTSLILYGSYLIVVYQDPNTTNKTIIINDGCDLLCSNPKYSVNDTEAAAYANFQNVNTSKAVNAKVIDVLASADGDGGANQAFFNGNVVGSFNSDYLKDPEIGFSLFNITSLLQNGTNTAAMQSHNNATKGDNMVALSSLLIVEYDTVAPTVSADINGGSYNASQSVNLTALDDQDSNPSIYYTTDGSDPTTSSTKYTGSISVAKTTTLKFMAVDAAGNHSNICNETYTIPDADVYVNSTVSETNPKVGDTVTVTLKVGNNGPDTAHGVVVTYTVPEGMEFVGATTDTPSASAPVYNATTRTVTWNLGDVPVGDPKLFVTLKVLSAGKLAGSAFVTSTSHDPISNDDTGSITVEAVNAQSSTGQSTVGQEGSSVANAAEVTTTSKVPMQKTGIPLAGFALAALSIFGGLLVPRRK